MCNNNPSPPPAPDYQGAAVAQGAANVEAARASAKLSNPNIIGPTGSQTVSYEGDIPTVTQTLAPDALQALQNQQRVQSQLSGLAEKGIGTAQNALAQPFNPNLKGLQTELTGVGSIPNAPNLGLYGQAQGSIDKSQLPQAPVNAGTTGQEAIMARLQPALAQQRSMKETQLRNQGLVAGGEAYDADMRNLGYQENDARSQAVLQGIGLDTAARSQGFGELQQQANLQNTAQAQVQNQGLQVAVSGTSAGAPSFAGIMAMIDQYTGSRAGNPNPRLYALAAQALGAHVAEHPLDGIHNVALAAAVRSDDSGEGALEVDHGSIGEGFESDDFQRLQIHGNSVKRC